MFSPDDAESTHDASRHASHEPGASLEYLLFESLVHHLIEKGLLTKNDALSVVQTVAQVNRGKLEERPINTPALEAELAFLRRLYASFEGLRDRPHTIRADGANVRQLRPPLHGERPQFPQDD